MIPVSVVIPQRKNTELTQQVIDQISRHDDPHEILVINDDPAETPDLGKIPVLCNGGRGVTSAWNLGCQYATAEHVLLLNNDVQCMGPFLSPMVELAGNAIVGAKKRKDLVAKKVLEGWCLLFRRDLWRFLGGFDEAMRYYYQDTDFMLRAKDYGFKLRQVDVMLLHMKHKTAHDKTIFPKQSQLLSDDRKVFNKKNAYRCA